MSKTGSKNFANILIIGGLLLSWIAMTALGIYFGCVYGSDYREQKQIVDAAASVEGEVVRLKKIGRNNVELHYEVGSESYTSVVTLQNAQFKQMDDDKDGVGAVTVFYVANEPEKGTCETAVTLLKKMRTGYIAMACMFGVFALAMLAIVIGANVEFGGKRKESRSNAGAVYGKRVVDLRTDFEKQAEANASKPLPEPLEGYAKEIVRLFGSTKSFDDCEGALRDIGKKMNNNEKQMRVAHRSNYLAAIGYRSGNERLGDFSLRYLEYAWDGLGGWMK